ncbi:acetyltransferase, GNAT family [Citrifermentans bemidjiense Bem]|uniref:Acetyltransferase, GNAT family n=1 Tax=Citrifermentans bemidjiense (strain ATCC BAA-1014 / DSM 16622 / JCM 12645 / Bem) TaxID=404380 RepID=B5EBR4_CITBB|nr:GNAT family N-acetyltransferase [Citrifermentans bemidjiense]ACH38938.1 acetyltransferase, GNAT family [Citrifermentans bemidjiense Bem]
MDIEYRYTQDFEQRQLQDLFLSVQWSSGQYPDKLQVAMKNSDCVISAWHGDTLVGLINALSDGVMTAYFHYLLVHPEYQAKGVGKQLASLALDKYNDYARKVLIAYDKEVGFYQGLGFEIGTGKTPMFVTFLTT